MTARVCIRCPDGATAPAVWRCKDCGASMCGDCLFSDLDCYDLYRECLGCGAHLPDTDGSGRPTDWAALGYGATP